MKTIEYLEYKLMWIDEELSDLCNMKGIPGVAERIALLREARDNVSRERAALLVGYDDI